MKIFDKDFKEIFSSQIATLLGGLISGTLLAIYTDKIFLLPGMLIIFPGFMEMRGNICGSLASRLTSGLFLGIIKSGSGIKTKIIKGNLFASLFLVILISIVLGLSAFFINFFILQIYTPKIILIPLLAGLIANMIEIPITIFTTLYLYKNGHDPNNIMGPFVTTIGDITSILSLLIAISIV